MPASSQQTTPLVYIELGSLYILYIKQIFTEFIVVPGKYGERTREE